ncbi:hypothetical protein HAX54_010257 [Datura stramonium]|uniref:Uncharacterized protein n=1 Tax=Datura stramonium TaxID=4076 RepID=A0ABS8THV1_DATST|nr:hypothetical protein [Datura stramonium]
MHRRFAEMNRHSAALPSFTGNHAQCTVSQSAKHRRFTNWIDDPPVARRLGAKASGNLCCIDDPPAVHGYESAFHRRVRRSNAPSPSLLFLFSLRWQFVLLDPRFAGPQQSHDRYDVWRNQSEAVRAISSFQSFYYDP